MIFTLEEQKERQKCLTGTDIGAILGLNPYLSPADIWLQKKGLVEAVPDNPRMKWGRLLEDIIDKEYCEITGYTTHKVKFKRKGIIGATPDRLIYGKKLGLEIKTVDSRLKEYYGEVGSDVIPKHYYLQCAWYMMFTKRPNWDVAVLIGGNDLRIYHIARDERLEERLKQIADQWWDKHIINDEQPVLSDTKQSLNWLEQTYPASNGEIIEAKAEQIQLAKKYAKLCADIDVLEQKKRDIEIQLKEAVGEHEGIRSRDFRFTWKKVKDSQKTDYKLACEMANVSHNIINTCSWTKTGYRRPYFKHTFNLDNLGD